MEFYDTLDKSASNPDSVSIPNGMEFYKCFISSVLWGFAVSIPNGMEFYLSTAYGVERVPMSFNSQRDGILPDRASEFYSRSYVSIPNGMEFY